MRYEIVQDESPANPRKEWDNLGRIVCWNRRYDLGDEMPKMEPAEWLVENWSDIAVILPIFMYDHSGIALSTTGSEYPFNDWWDAGQVGYAYATHDAVMKEFNRKRMSKKLLAQVQRILKSEVETYAAYVSGEVYGYVIYDDNDNEVDSCWGFYGHKDAVAAAEEFIAEV